MGEKACRLCHLHNNLGFYLKTFREKYFTCQNKILTLTSHTKPLKSRKGSTTAVTFIQAWYYWGDYIMFAILLNKKNKQTNKKSDYPILIEKL